MKDQPPVTSTICELSTSRCYCLGCGNKMQILDWPRKARNALRRGLGCSQVGVASRNSEPKSCLGDRMFRVILDQDLRSLQDLPLTKYQDKLLCLELLRK